MDITFSGGSKMRAEIEKSYRIACLHEIPHYPPCSKEHTHEYEITVNVHAWVIEETGMVMDYNKMDEVINKYANKNLNDIFSIPSVENFALAIADGIIAKLKHYSRVSVTICESENTKVTIVR